MTSRSGSWPIAVLYKRWNEPRSRFGDLMVVTFMVMQCLDGVLTYMGVRIWGPAIEANPLITGLMASFGHGPGLVTAKAVAVVLGIALHLRGVHGAIALLSGFYLLVAVLPWAAILFG